MRHKYECKIFDPEIEKLISREDYESKGISEDGTVNLDERKVAIKRE
jgi:hypothetical protein